MAVPAEWKKIQGIFSVQLVSFRLRFQLITFWLVLPFNILFLCRDLITFANTFSTSTQTKLRESKRKFYTSTTIWWTHVGRDRWKALLPNQLHHLQLPRIRLLFITDLPQWGHLDRPLPALQCTKATQVREIKETLFRIYLVKVIFNRTWWSVLYSAVPPATPQSIRKRRRKNVSAEITRCTSEVSELNFYWIIFIIESNFILFSADPYSSRPIVGYQDLDAPDDTEFFWVLPFFLALFFMSCAFELKEFCIDYFIFLFGSLRRLFTSYLINHRPLLTSLLNASQVHMCIVRNTFKVLIELKLSFTQRRLQNGIW